MDLLLELLLELLVELLLQLLAFLKYSSFEQLEKRFLIDSFATVGSSGSVYGSHVPSDRWDCVRCRFLRGSWQPCACWLRLFWN